MNAFNPFTLVLEKNLETDLCAAVTAYIRDTGIDVIVTRSENGKWDGERYDLYITEAYAVVGTAHYEYEGKADLLLGVRELLWEDDK